MTKKTATSYKEALANKERLYCSSEPCPRCGNDIFLTSKRFCVECDHATQAAYRQSRRITGQNIAAERREEHLRLREACRVQLTPWRDAMANVRYNGDNEFPDQAPWNYCSRPPLTLGRLRSASSAYSASMS
jgi:ribosomal protein L37E